METKRNETKRNETKRNETKRNETKRNETKRMETRRTYSHDTAYLFLNVRAIYKFEDVVVQIIHKLGEVFS